MKEPSIAGIARAAVWGLVLGGGVGFALGMLLAPEEGQKLRRRLAFQLDNLSGEIGKWVDSFSAAPESSEARQKGESLIADVEQRARQIQHDMDQLLERYPSRRSAASN
ncbi:MAG: YtxH domain-containing protein [Bacteroidetes bacterium]|nr:YtxH domain-containing protein [Bacteroidota bacterium]